MKRAVVLIVKDSLGRVLLLKRTKEDKNFPSEWCLPGGKVDPLGEFKDYTFQESDDLAIIRECIEETGVVPTFVKDTHVTAIGSDQKYIVRVFTCLNHVEHSEVTKEFPNREHETFDFFEYAFIPKETGKLTKKILDQFL